MQNKGFIRLFAILLTLVSIYQLSFTFVTRKIEKQAKEFAKGDMQKEYHYLDSLGSEVVYNLGIIDFTYKKCKALEINMGLDLKGGMNVVLEVSVPDIVNALSNFSKDPTFLKAMDLAKNKMKDSQEDFITLFGKSFEQVDPGARLAAVFNTIELKEKISYNSTNNEVLKVIRSEAEGAISNSFNVLRTRIDRFGVAQPNIQQLGLKSAGRILVELPGVKDRERVRKLLQGTANLEFWETYDFQQIYGAFTQANQVIKDFNTATENGVGLDTTKTASDTTVNKAANDLEALKAKMASEGKKDDVNAKDRAKEYPLFSVLNPNFTQDGQVGSGPVVGYALAKDTAQVNKYLNMPQVRSVLPRELKLGWTVKPYDKAGQVYQLIALKVTTRNGVAPLDGSVITDARADFGQGRATAEVEMAMNGEGANTWARLTKENIGHSIAIVLDGYVYSFPNVQGEITGGRSQITGNFTVEEAKDLANVLKSGKMPAPAYIVNEDIVGPSLGKEAINSGFGSFAIAFILVLVYMVFYYGVTAGLVADIALIVNLFFLMGVLASFTAVLTLPGIAGIVLTLGMAVDANVIIYERIREELAAGKGMKVAISEGYSNAFSAIFDGNFTTMLTGIILFMFGSGPIRGFATTLMIGIATSFFTGVFVSRLIYEWLLSKDYKLSFDTKITHNFLRNPKWDFIGTRKTVYWAIGIYLMICLVSVVFKGFDKGIDFTGGRNYVIRFEKAVTVQEVQASLKNAFEGAMPDAKTFGSDNQIKVGTNYKINEVGKDIDDIVETKLFEGVKQFLPATTTFESFKNNNIMSSSMVGPTIADDIKKQAFWAVLFSLIGISLYIFLRFRNWRFSVGALASLVHDTLFVIGLYSLLSNIMPFSMQIDQSFIAAILTVIGYSINDTVIIYDRIRERMGLFPKKDLEENMNKALNQTLGRTLNTALTTLLVLLAILLFGGEVIRGFVFALFIGILIGTFSSVYVATPVSYDLIKKYLAKQDKA